MKLLAVLAAAGFASAAWSGSLNYCQGAVEPGAAAQDRLIQVAAIVKESLQDSGQSVALLSRSGLSLSRLGQRYSHAGVSLKDSPNTPWSVRQLYYACDAHKPKIFDQGISGFVLGLNNPEAGFVSVLLLPPEAAAALQRAALDAQLVAQLLGPTYSANAYAFSTRYQNCNQWLAELLAAAWGSWLPEDDPRGQAQQWLRQESYAPTKLHVGWRPLMWLAAWLPWLHSDDHPQSDLDAAQFQVSMPASIEAFARARWPEAQRLEICFRDKQVVLRRGWEPLGDDCQAAAGDEVRALQ